ncbi:NADH-quinone oxidoreductase subunit K, partial [Bartonella grahamii]|uniref:NADH-quinone oxidoreductase subunit K n=1 Tax=Bartonella grahamii TaxID=33045 RepID=UPI001ABAF123
ILGLSLISYGANLFMFSMSGPCCNAAAIVDPTTAINRANYVDPLPQSLGLTAIGIGFATAAFFLVFLFLF